MFAIIPFQDHGSSFPLCVTLGVLIRHVPQVGFSSYNCESNSNQVCTPGLASILTKLVVVQVAWLTTSNSLLLPVSICSPS